MFAVSRKLRPASRARSMIVRASASSVCSPNNMPPGHKALTWTPVRPKPRYSMAIDLLAKGTVEPPSAALVWAPAGGGEVPQQRLGVLQVGGVEALGELAVDRREELTSCITLTLPLPQAA